MCGICGIVSTDPWAVIEPAVIRRMHDTLGRTDHQNEVWYLLMLELWHRVFVDGSSIPHDADYKRRTAKCRSLPAPSLNTTN
jgi:hypothetical protein